MSLHDSWRHLATELKLRADIHELERVQRDAETPESRAKGLLRPLSWRSWQGLLAAVIVLAILAWVVAVVT
ncbi:MAG: hypothetical protein ACKVVT_17235 [Dehalococcoidia bacterium]